MSHGNSDDVSKVFIWLVVGEDGDDDGDVFAVDIVNVSVFGCAVASVSIIFFGDSQCSASVSSCGCDE